MGWIRCTCNAHRKQVAVKQLYNQVPQTVWCSWSSRQTEFSLSCSHSSSSSCSWGQDAVVRASTRQRTWALRTPVEQRSRMRWKCCYSIEELGVNMLLSVPSPTQPFRKPFVNKVWEVYFSKEVRSFVIIVDYVSVYSYINIYIMWLYNTGALQSDCLVPYTGDLQGRGLNTLLRCSQYILQPQPTGPYFIDGFQSNTFVKT